MSSPPSAQQSPRCVPALPPVGRTVVAGFESTYVPLYGVDVLDIARHEEHWPADLADLVAAGVRHLRAPVRWAHVEREPGRFDWSWTDRFLGSLADAGVAPVLDLVHHTSYPDWLRDGFRDTAFGPAFVRWAEAVAQRYPWLTAYTLFNEPFATCFLAGHEALWPPYDRGVAGFRRVLLSVLPALSRASASWREALPGAAHVWVDTAEHHRGAGAAGRAAAAVADDRRHCVLDLALGRDVDEAAAAGRPFVAGLLEGPGEALRDLEPLTVDVLGLDYYSHSEWWYDDDGARSPSPRPVGFAAVARHYGDRYGLPLMLSETNVRGTPADRVSWLRYMVEQYDEALADGVALHGFCWYPQVDSTDWDSLLARCAGRVDPVGVRSLDAHRRRRRSVVTTAWEAVVAGAGADDLPAWTWQPPCDTELAGYAEQTAHWPWQDPPPADRVPVLRADLAEAAMTDVTENRPGTDEPDLVVLSHLRWSWVWQRPQHLVARLARERAARGARTFFVEEPVQADVGSPTLRHDDVDGVTRVWLEVPDAGLPVHRVGFDHPDAAQYDRALAGLLDGLGRPDHPDVWLYTPMALDLARRLSPGRLVYDVMDDLAAFKDAPSGMVLRRRRLLADADVVLTGGPSLHESVLRQRTSGVHLFRSGVDTDHYARSRVLRGRRSRYEPPVAGYVGVVDERLDLGLLADLAAALPQWTVRVVGPVAKIDPSALPRRRNLEYLGQQPYDRLPEVMAGFDVALMPFALNDATRSISPTKTLEYLAAGLPVVSTRVPDVVADYAGVVELADDAAGFAAACARVLGADVDARDRAVRPLQARQEWDAIARGMAEILDAHRARAGTTSSASPAVVDLSGATELEEETA